MCYSPVTIKTPQGYKKVPCHHCLECLTKYQQDWSNRMYEELKEHDGKGVFFTLTYDELHVPKNYLRYGTDKETKEATYELFRSPSDYGYSNCYTEQYTVIVRSKGTGSILGGDKIGELFTFTR